MVEVSGSGGQFAGAFDAVDIFAQTSASGGMKREIWFEKVLWSYMPCHWKGIVAMAAIIIPTVVAILLAQFAANAIGYKDADWLSLPIFLAGWFSMMVFAKRHS